MRIAVLADIHANIHAFEAVLEQLEKQSIDQIVIAGDIVIGCPSSKACWETVKGLNCTVIRGNHERYLFDLDSPHAPSTWKTERYGPVHQAYPQFTIKDINDLRNLPAHQRLDDLLIVHASYRNDTDNPKHSTEAELDEMFATDAAFIVRAHNHVWFDRQWNSRNLFSIGSVGVPLNGDSRAQYAILSNPNGLWNIEKQFITYDLGEALKSFDHVGYLDIAGPIGKLKRQELLTAKHQLTPFWKQFGNAYDKGELTLEQAVNQYLHQ
jgi:predicted phosphodiesterase